MAHLDTEIQIIKTNILEMWDLVLEQLSKTAEAIENNNKDLVKEIFATEKKIDAFELKIDMDCENIIALFNPVANDLRFVLAVLKINYNLERIGDYAYRITKILEESSFNKESLRETRIKAMFETTITMLIDTRRSFESEDIHKLIKVINKDDKLDKLNKNAKKVIVDLIEDGSKNVSGLLNLISVFSKLERAGDQTKSIAEEIIFYIEAKVLRHKKKKAAK
jgi:phosphate transport system protein